MQVGSANRNSDRITGDKGNSYQGAVAVAPGVWLRQATSDGLALELTVKGKKYYKSTTRMPISTDTSHTRWIKPRERVMHPGDRHGAEIVAARPFASSESSLTSCSAEVPTA